jgi:hypothetical protein
MPSLMSLLAMERADSPRENDRWEIKKAGAELPHSKGKFTHWVYY